MPRQVAQATHGILLHLNRLPLLSRLVTLRGRLNPRPEFGHLAGREVPRPDLIRVVVRRALLDHHTSPTDTAVHRRATPPQPRRARPDTELRTHPQSDGKRL